MGSGTYRENRVPVHGDSPARPRAAEVPGRLSFASEPRTCHAPNAAMSAIVKRIIEGG